MRRSTRLVASVCLSIVVASFAPRASTAPPLHRFAAAVVSAAATFADPTEGPDPVEPLPTAELLARVKSPGPQMHFTAGLPLRLFADAVDNERYRYQTDTTKVRLYVDDRLTATLRPFPGELNHWEYRLAAGLPVGDHTIAMDITPHADDLGARARTFRGAVLVAIHIDPLPGKSNRIELKADVVLKGSHQLDWTNAVVIGHGFRIVSEPDYRGTVKIQNSFVTGLGSYDERGIDISTSGNIQIDHSVFEASGPLRLAANGKAQVNIGPANEFRANNFVTWSASNPDLSPILDLTADTSGRLTFKGNNVAFGMVWFHGGTNWDIGGTRPEDSNVLMGPRAVLRVENASRPHVYGNYLHHDYKNGSSQGFTLQMPGSKDALVEDNLLREGSWPLQDVSGEVRRNVIIDEGGHDAWRSARPTALIHHNIFTYLWHPGMPLSGTFFFYQGEEITSIDHNTFDMGGAETLYDAPAVALDRGAHVLELHSNAFVGWSGTKPLITGEYQPFAVDHNADFRDGSDPHFAAPRDIVYKVQEGRVWNRQVSVFDVLAYYRAKYTPAAGSPLIGAGRGGTNQGAIQTQASREGPKPASSDSPNHPRLLLTPALLAKLKTKAAAKDRDWLTLKASADQLLHKQVAPFSRTGCPENAICYEYQGGGWGTALPTLGLVYQVTGNPAYAAKVLQIIGAITATHTKGDLTPISADSGYPSRSAAAGFAIAYDWVYNRLDVATKASIFDTMNAWFDWYKATALDRDGPAYSNYFGGHVLGFGYIGMATTGENPRGAEIATYVRSRFDASVSAAFADGVFTGGYPVEGYVYGTNHFVRLLNYMQAVKTATGEDLISHSGYAEKILRSLLYNLKPNRWQFTDEADYAGDLTGIMDPTLIAMLPVLTVGTPESAYAQFFFRNRVAPPTAYPPAIDPLQLLLWYDAALPAADYRRDLPTAHWSPGDDHLYVRSDWGDDAVWTSFRAGALFLGGHAARSAGHIAIQRGNDYLLVNSGQWKGKQGWGGDPQAFDGRNWRLNTLWYQNPWRPPYEGGQGVWGTDAILASRIAPSYAYVKADLTSAYTNTIPTGLKSFTRSVIVLRPSGIVIVFDRVHAGNPQDMKKIVWHVNPNGARRLDGDVFDTGVVGASRLFIKTACCLEKPLLSIVPDPVSDNDQTPVTYRLEVTDGAATSSMDLITVLEATSSKITSMSAVQTSTRDEIHSIAVAGQTVSFTASGDLVDVR